MHAGLLYASEELERMPLDASMKMEVEQRLPPGSVNTNFQSTLKLHKLHTGTEKSARCIEDRPGSVAHAQPAAWRLPPGLAAGQAPHLADPQLPAAPYTLHSREKSGTKIAIGPKAPVAL